MASEHAVMSTLAYKVASSAQRRGYVLLATLMLLALVATAMMAACRLSLHQALAAMEAERTLRTRWAVVSLRANASGT